MSKAIGQVAAGARYSVHEQFAEGGMATLHLGHQVGARGSPAVAVKRLHAHLAEDTRFVTLFVDEARVAARIRHPNVVTTLDVVEEPSGVLQVMELVQGESLAYLCQRARSTGTPMPAGVAARVVVGVLHGLHAAHDATGRDGKPLELLHLDVSPQSVLVGVDGVARVLDFGLAKAKAFAREKTRGIAEGQMAYMAPEQLGSGEISRATDIYAVGVMLWEMLHNERLRTSSSPQTMAPEVLLRSVRPPAGEAGSSHGSTLEDVVRRACSKNPSERFASALEMADAVEAAASLASQHAVSRYVRAACSPTSMRLRRLLTAMETSFPSMASPPAPTALISASAAPRPAPLLISGLPRGQSIAISHADEAGDAPAITVLAEVPSDGEEAGARRNTRSAPALTAAAAATSERKPAAEPPPVAPTQRASAPEASSLEALVRAPRHADSDALRVMGAAQGDMWSDLLPDEPQLTRGNADAPPPTIRGLYVGTTPPKSDADPTVVQVRASQPEVDMDSKNGAPFALRSLPPAVVIPRPPISAAHPISGRRSAASLGRIGAVAVVAVLALGVVMMRARSGIGVEPPPLPPLPPLAAEAPAPSETADARSAEAEPAEAKPAPAASAAARPAAAKAEPVAAEPCDPPFIVQPDGTRVMRPGCG